MNQLNQTLATIRRQKTIYNTILKQTQNKKEKQKLQEKIQTLAQEEQKILNKNKENPYNAY